MRNLICTTVFSLLTLVLAEGQLPYKYDSLYKTIYASQLCMLLNQDTNLVLIDVRSASEYNESPEYNSYSFGHLKGAVNIEIDAMKKNINVLAPFNNKTMVVYCSHSSRSRAVSKLLSEKGFTNFYNLNGGISNLNQLNDSEFPCKKNLLVSNAPFINLSYNETMELIQNEKQLFILDVRPASQFNSKDSLITKNVGRIKSAVNIPYTDLRHRMDELVKYKDQKVLVYTSTGDGDAARTAFELTKHGFKTVYQMLGGINSFISSRENIPFLENPTPYTLVDSHRALLLLENTKGLIIYDTRENDEYFNKLNGDKISYKNVGHIKNAVHIVESEFQSCFLPSDKNTPILIYGHQEAFRFAAMLAGKGFTQVFLLDGLNNFVWAAFNLENCRNAKSFLADHEGLY